MKRSRLLLLAAVFGLVGCGRIGRVHAASLAANPRTELAVALPVKPAMARTTPTVQQLLTPPTYARPDRVDELVKRSQPRPADPFDLPPPSGGEAPSLPAGSNPSTVPDTTTTTSTPGE